MLVSQGGSATPVNRPRVLDRRLVGRCGMYCGHCHIYRAYRDSPSLRVKLAAKYGCSPGDIRCDGCQVVRARGWSGDSHWGRYCRILECLGDRGVRFCHECPTWPNCPGWTELAENYHMFGVDLKANLEMIRDGKVLEWLDQQDRKWRCVHCHSPIAVSEEIGHCLRCGKVPHY